jgi:hypothetical protein
MTPVVLTIMEAQALAAMLRELESERHIPGYGDCCVRCDRSARNEGHSAECDLKHWIQRLTPEGT